MLDSNTSLHRVKIVLAFVWMGFVGGISFMEAWLKFQAPGITLPLGLGIGRLVFAALNKVELVLGFSILALEVRDIIRDTRHLNLFVIPLCILVLQTFWLLPQLDARAKDIIDGKSVGDSYLHISYVVLEFIKILTLFIYGIKNFSRENN